MSEIDVNHLLSQMRALAVQSQGQPQEITGGAERTDFAALLRDSIDRVNETQQRANGLAETFERGDGDVDLAQVMVALQKATLSFQAMTQVRNKLVSAYQEIMGMPV